MTASTDHAASIRWRLFGTLFVPAAAVLIAGTVTTYLTVVPLFIDAYDQALLESALAIAAHVQPDANGRLELSLPPDALAILGHPISPPGRPRPLQIRPNGRP